MKVVIAEVGKPARIEDVKLGYEYVKGVVGGFIEPFSVIDGITLWVNEEGILMNLPPNRVIYATKQMERDGFLNPLKDWKTVCKAGEPFQVLYGNIIAASEDEEGDFAGLTDEQAKFAKNWLDIGVCLTDEQVVELARSMGMDVEGDEDID